MQELQPPRLWPVDNDGRGTRRPGRRTGGQECKTMAKIEPKSRAAQFWLVIIIINRLV